MVQNVEFAVGILTLSATVSETCLFPVLAAISLFLVVGPCCSNLSTRFFRATHGREPDLLFEFQCYLIVSDRSISGFGGHLWLSVGIA